MTRFNDRAQGAGSMLFGVFRGMNALSRRRDFGGRALDLNKPARIAHFTACAIRRAAVEAMPGLPKRPRPLHVDRSKWAWEILRSLSIAKYLSETLAPAASARAISQILALGYRASVLHLPATVRVFLRHRGTRWQSGAWKCKPDFQYAGKCEGELYRLRFDAFRSGNAV